MEKLTREMYDFLIQEENFEFAYEIYESFPDVRDCLIKRFWEAVEVKLKDLTEGTKWDVKFWEGMFSTYSKFGLYTETEDLRIIYEKIHEKPYYGLWLNTDSEILNRDNIINLSESVDFLQQRGGYDGKYWIGREETGDDFHNIRTLTKILPNKNKELANEYAEELFGFAKNINDEILKKSH